MRTVRVSDVEAALVARLVRDFADGVGSGSASDREWTGDAADMDQLDGLAKRFEGETDDDD